MEGRKSSEYKKGLWTEEEDKILTDYIQLHGKGKWNRLAKHTGLKRCGKSCRLRWINYLSPNVNRGHFTKEEDDLIIRLHNLLGNRWALIAGRVPGRTDNQVKNHWNTHLCKIYGNKLKKGKARVGETLSSKSDCSGTKPDEVVQVVPEIDHGSGFEDYNDDYYGNCFWFLNNDFDIEFQAPSLMEFFGDK